MLSRSMSTSKEARRKALERLRIKRASGRRNEVTVGAHLLELRKRGEITAEEFDFVMGISSDSPLPKKE